MKIKAQCPYCKKQSDYDEDELRNRMQSVYRGSNNSSPEIQVVVKCPKCGKDYKIPITSRS